MARGRKAVPTQLKVIRGNPGKRKLETACPQPEPLFLPPPDFLDQAAADEWRRVMPELIRWGLFSRLDLASLAAYCTTYALWRRAKETLDAEGATYETEGKHGKMRRYRPEFVVAMEAMRQMRAFAGEFGLTPVARVRLKGTAQGELPLPSAETPKAANSRWDALD